MARLRFECGKCGKRITAYKSKTSSRRKCSGCGSYTVRPVPDAPSQASPASPPTWRVSPTNEEIPDSALPPVSIVIPTYNGWPHLEKCLPSLRGSDYPREKVEVIVVDNASSDGTARFVKKQFPWVTLIRQEENHYCKANNAGIRAAKGEYVCLLNNDTEVEKFWLRELVKVIHPNPEIGAVGSKVLLLSGRIHTTGHYEQPNHHWGDRGFEEEDRGQYDEIEEVPSLCGVSVLYRRKCLDDVGLLDECFVAYYEDVDMSLRCRKRGWKLFYVPKSVVHHFYNGTAANLQQEGTSFSRYYTERNRLLLLAKHQPDKLPDALSTFSHFYVDKDYRILYQALPVVLPALFENADSKRLPELLPCLFENLRKITVYETEGIRSERVIYQQRLKELEEEWQKNLVKEIREKEKEWKEELEKRTSLCDGRLTELEGQKAAQMKSLRDELEGQKAAQMKSLRDEHKKRELLLAGQRKEEGREQVRRLGQAERQHKKRELLLAAQRKEERREQVRRLGQAERRHKGEVEELNHSINGLNEEKGALIVRTHLLEQDVGRKTTELASLREESEESALLREKEIRHLRESLLRKEQEIGRLSYDLTIAREHPLAKLSNRLRLDVYREGSKDALLAELRCQAKTKERDLEVALRRLDAEYEKFRALQDDNEQKVRQFLENEQRITDQHSEILDLRKRLAIHEREISSLVQALDERRKAQGRKASPPVPSGESAGWLPAVSDVEAGMPLVFEPSAKPESVHLSITQRCNLRCRHCAIWRGKGKDQLSGEEVKMLLGRLRSWLGDFTLNIAGGEPFMRKDFLEILGHAKSLGIGSIVTTNAHAIDEGMAKRISRSGHKGINVSIDGPEDVHDSIRGVPGSYRRAVRALNLLNSAKKDTHVTVTTVVNALNLQHLSDLVRLVADMGLDGITFQALCSEFSSGFRWDWRQHTPLWPKDAEQLGAALDELVRLKLRGYPINNSVAHLQDMKHYFSHPGQYPGGCRVGLRSLHLNEKGDCLLCWNMPPLGNALRDDPKQLWMGAKAHLQRHQIQKCSRECFILNCNYIQSEETCRTGRNGG